MNKVSDTVFICVCLYVCAKCVILYGSSFSMSADLLVYKTSRPDSHARYFFSQSKELHHNLL